MSNEQPSDHNAVSCPICGAPAEDGHIWIFGGGHEFRWNSGSPTFWKQLTAGSSLASDPGQAIPSVKHHGASCIPGIRCKKCGRVVLDPYKRPE